jgi:hypothetical protein
MLNKIKYEILRKTIPKTQLVSSTSQNWFDWDGNQTPWLGSIYVGPNINDIYYNTTGSLSEGYYRWTGLKWFKIKEESAFESYNLPIFLENTTNEFGVMVGFDGYMEQVDQIVNFTYTQIGNTVTVYNSSNPYKIKNILEQNYTISWGDGDNSQIKINDAIGSQLSNVSHTYAQPNDYTISISLNTPWNNQTIKKNIKVPQDLKVVNEFGTISGLTIPAYDNMTGQTQDYLKDLDYTNNTGYTTNGFTYLAIGKSRISEKKLYGQNEYSGVTYGTDNVGNYSAYTIDNLYYKDYPDNFTSITGTTSGYTKEEVFNKLITRNEHFLGFIDEPSIYSDIFVERGKQSVSENNLRLCDIDSVGELDTYENEFFTIKKL